MGNKSFFKKVLVVAFLLTALFTEIQPLENVFAANLRFYNYNTGSTVNYSGKQVTYTYNNRELKLSYPGILINGTALADYQELFVHELGLQAELDGSKITFSDGTTKLVLTVDSKTVSKNGKKDTMSVAPVKLKINDTIKYYVPTRYVAETFGFSYSWHSDISTVKITKPIALSIDGKDLSYHSTVYAVNYQNKRIHTEMPVFYHNGIVLVPAEQIFESAGCTYKENGTTIHITKKELSLYLEHNNKTAYVNEKKIISNTAPMQITDRSNGNTSFYVSLEFVADMLGFELTYSDEECCYTLKEKELTGSIALYPDLVAGVWKQEITEDVNELPPQELYYEWIADEAVNSTTSSEQKYLSKVIAYATEKADVVELYGITKNDISDFFDGGKVILELNNVTSDMKVKFFSDYSLPHLHYTLLSSVNNKIILRFIISTEDKWTIMETEDCVRIYFASADLSVNDLHISSSKVYPDDKIIIPLHENVQNSDISDEDYYWNHNFTIEITGNYVEYYQQASIINPYYGVEISDTYYDEKINKTIFSIKTDFICGYNYTIYDNYMVLHIGKPEEIYSKIL